MKIKRTLSVMLCLAMLAVPFAGCSETSESIDTTAAATDAVSTAEGETTEEETKRWLDNLPETMDFNEQVIRVLVEEGGNGSLSARSVWVDEGSADVVDAAIYERNLATMERLNVKIETLQVLTTHDTDAMLMKSVTAGSDDYDLVGTYQYYGIKSAINGYVLNLGNQDYIDFSQKYWATDYINNMSYKGASYWATGDIALRYLGGMYVTYVNTTLWKDLYAEENVYNVVRDGLWTLDYLREKSEGAYVDLNGNQRLDIKDQLGLYVNYTQDPIEGIAAGSLVKWGELDEGGNPVITLNSERTINFYQKVYSLLIDNPASLMGAADDSVGVMNAFAAGTVFATINKVFQAEIYLREMTDDYYILPVPKYDEAQTQYNTMLHDSVTLFGVPIVCGNVEAVTATLECLASEAYRLVLPAYYETALKVKYSRDTESGEMLDLIHDNVSSDFVCLYSNSLSDIAHFFRNALNSKKTDISSEFAKYEKVWGKSMERMLDKLESNSDL